MPDKQVKCGFCCRGGVCRRRCRIFDLRMLRLTLKFIVNSLFVLVIIGNEAFAQKFSSNNVSADYLDSALYMLIKAKNNYPEVVQVNRPQDCADVLNSGNLTSGIYRIWPRNRVMEGRSVKVYCDMKTGSGGWTIIQRRGNFLRHEDYFYKDWESYKRGFGDLDKDFWLGNDNIFAISNQRTYSARFDLWDVGGNTRYALYDSFWIDDEFHKYMLHIKDYRGDAGDSMYPIHDGQKFSTKDQTNDNRNKTESCAEFYKGGWWYNACHKANLNGLYLKGKYQSHANGICWQTWKGSIESLNGTEIKLRPKDFQRNRHLTLANQT